MGGENVKEQLIMQIPKEKIPENIEMNLNISPKINNILKVKDSKGNHIKEFINKLTLFGEIYYEVRGENGEFYVNEELEAINFPFIY